MSARIALFTVCLTFSSSVAWTQSASSAPASAGAPRFSPDGRRIVFNERPSGAPWRLYIMNVDGTNEQELIAGVESVLDANFDPAGKWLLYRSAVLPNARGSGAPVPPELRGMRYSIVGVDGKNPRVVVTGELLGGAAWAPDGRRVSVSMRTGVRPNAVQSMFIVDVDGSNRRELVTGLPWMQVGAWARDGRLAFPAPSANGFQIVISDRDGNGRRPVAPNGPVYQSDPVWSPDGNTILFEGSDVAPSPDGRGRRLYSIRTDGTAMRELIGDSSKLQAATFSSDGSEILFVDARENNTDIYLMNADGTNQRRLTTDTGFDEYPSFSPDGRSILFQRAQPGQETHIYIMNRDRSAQRRIR